MKIGKMLLLGLFVSGFVLACSKDDTDDGGDGGGGNPADSTSYVQATLGSESFASDTVFYTKTSRYILIKGAPKVGFLPSVSITLTPDIETGTYAIGVSGRVETASFAVADGVFLGNAGGEIIIEEHRVGEFIKGSFDVVGSNSQYPDRDLKGTFQLYYE